MYVYYVYLYFQHKNFPNYRTYIYMYICMYVCMYVYYVYLYCTKVFNDMFSVNPGSQMKHTHACTQTQVHTKPSVKVWSTALNWPLPPSVIAATLVVTVSQVETLALGNVMVELSVVLVTSEHSFIGPLHTMYPVTDTPSSVKGLVHDISTLLSRQRTLTSVISGGSKLPAEFRKYYTTFVFVL